MKSWGEVTPEHNCALHKGVASLLYFEPATRLPSTCAVLQFQHSISVLSSKLRCRKSCLQTQQRYAAYSSSRETQRSWCYSRVTPPGLSRTFKGFLVSWSTFLAVSGFLVFLWMDGHNGKPSWHKEWPDYQKGFEESLLRVFCFPLIHSHVSFHQLKALKWHRRLFRATLWQHSWVKSMVSNPRSSWAC